MSRYRTAAGWSAGMLATAAAALLTASATLPGSAAHLEVDGGVLQVFVLAGPDLPGPPEGVPPGPPDDRPGGPPDGVSGGPPDGVVTGPPADDSEDPSAGPADPSDQPSDKQQKPDEPSDKPDKSDGESDQSDPSLSDPDPGQQQSERDSTDEESTMAATMSAPAPEVRYEDCAEAHEAGAVPLDADDPGYRPELDDDRDGRACEQGEG